MKIVIANGPDKGKEVEARLPFTSIGRETDNDLVLSDAQASRYHAKVEMDGTVWVVKDLNSSNGVRLNGVRISESAPLTDKDEISIGETTLTVGFAAGESPEPPTVADEVSMKKPATTATTAAADAKAAAQKRVRLLAVALITLLVVVAAIVLLPEHKPPQRVAVAVDPFAAIKDKPLTVYYCRERSGREHDDQPYNIFIYQVQLKDRALKVSVRDLIDGLEQDQTAEISEAEETHLKQILLTDEFLEAHSRVREKSDFVERIQVMAAAGRRGNSVEYRNETESVPEGVARVISELDNLVDEKTKVNRLPRSVAFAEAEKLYLNGRKWFAEKDVYPENLYKSVKSLSACEKYLEGYDDAPEFYEDAIRQLKESQEVLDSRLNELKDAARFQERTDLLKAKDTYQEILDRIPDDRHPDYRFAKDKIFEINRKLRK